MSRNVATGALTNYPATRDVTTGQLVNVGVGGLLTADAFTGNGSQTVFTLSNTPVVGSVVVFVFGAVSTANTPSGNTVAFTSAPANGASIVVEYLR